jgi:hypothetical protein
MSLPILKTRKTIEPFPLNKTTTSRLGLDSKCHPLLLKIQEEELKEKLRVPKLNLSEGILQKTDERPWPKGETTRDSPKK